MIDTKNTTTYKQYAAILIGGSLCLPVIMVGFELVPLFGTIGALIAIGLGNALLVGMALLMAKITLVSRQTTLELAVEAFGRVGMPFFASMIVIVMLGWFAIQLDLISTNIQLFIHQYSNAYAPRGIIAIVVGLLMTCASMSGLQLVGRWARYIVCALIITLIIALVRSWAHSGGFIAHPTALCNDSLCNGVAIVLAALLGLVLDVPTLMCNARSKADAYKGLIITFGLGVPLIELVGVLFANLGGAGNSLMHQLMSGPLAWQLLSSTCFILSEGVSNVLNLYSAAMSLHIAMPQRNLKTYILMGGITASCAAAMGIAHTMLGLLNILGIFMSSMGVGVIGWYIQSACSFKRSQTLLFSGLIAGIAGGLCSAFGFFAVSSSALFDSAITSVSVYAIGTLWIEFFDKKKN